MQACQRQMRLIDAQLRATGWEVDSELLTYKSGARSQKGKNRAIAEYPMAGGRADYALFVGLQIVAIVEAKRQSKDVAEGALNQAKRGIALRDYQIQAIKAVEAALSKGQRELLVAMATGTGKTKMCIALVYRLLKTKRFRRVLFLVDRTALGEQTANAFKESRMENLQTFADIFELKDLKDTDTDTDTKVHIATVQGMVKRFIRRVNSRILYEQMLGRATRRCDDIGKEVFRVFDAVRLYEAIASVSSMKPIVVNPKISFVQLVEELGTVTKPDAVEGIIDQLLSKFQRKRRHLSENSQEQLEQLAGMPIGEFVPHLKQSDAAQVRTWFEQRQAIAQILDRQDGGTQPILISYHADELLGIEQGYGVSEGGMTYGKTRRLSR